MKRFEFLCELMEAQSLPPSELVEWAQFVLDTEIEPWYTKYHKLLNYCVSEGMCYHVQSSEGY